MKSKSNLTDILFVITLFCLYLVCTLSLCIIGVNIYEKSINDSDKNYNIRTSVLYITEKARQNLTYEGIRVEEANGNSALVLSKEIEGTTYDTWIYVENEYLCEVLTPFGNDIIPNIGQKIMPMEELNIEFLQDNLLSVSVKDANNEIYTSIVYLRYEESEG